MILRRSPKMGRRARRTPVWAAGALCAAQMVGALAAPVIEPPIEPRAAVTGGSVVGKARFNLGADPTGRVCTARRLYGDPLLRDDRRDFAYDINCARAGGVGRVYLLGSAPRTARTGFGGLGFGARQDADRTLHHRR